VRLESNKYHVIEMCRGTEVRHHHSWTSAPDEAGHFHDPGRVIPREASSQYPLERRPGEPQTIWTLWDVLKMFLL
jgi:hypothetical protein